VPDAAAAFFCSGPVMPDSSSRKRSSWFVPLLARTSLDARSR
jgi:hypothetical protein